MKFARWGERGAERPAVIDEAGNLRDLSPQIGDIYPGRSIFLGPGAPLNEIDIASLPLVDPTARLACPLAGVGKFVAIGLNYRDHAEEAGLPIPEEPVIFMKAPSCISGPTDNVRLPRGSEMMDWEAELGIVIGRRTRYVEEEECLAHIAGYVLVNDLSERHDQMQRGGTWDKGKSHDGFGPIGPWFVTADELDPAAGIPLVTTVNGKRMQNGSTANMIFSVTALVAYVSRFMTLEPGDIITTGTPAGVGLGQRPDPVFLREGDLLELDGGPLGTQRQHIIASL